MRQNSVTFLYLLLGSLTAFGPLVTDMYLPALPAMTESFHTSMPMVQLGLTFSMIGLAAGQLLFGPLSTSTAAVRCCSSRWRCLSFQP